MTRAIAAVVLLCLGPAAHVSEAQAVRIESIYPRQLPRGQRTVVAVAVPSRDPIQAIELSPSQGITVASVVRGENVQGAMTWSALTLDVAREAAPGDRTLAVVLPSGRSAPVTVAVPTHVPAIADLRIASIEPRTIEVEVAAADASADLGELPHVWFMLRCGGEPLPGVVRGRAMPRGVVRVSMPTGRPDGDALPARRCGLEVRLTDSAGVESNTLTTTVDIPTARVAPAASPRAAPAASAGGGDWVEIVSREERFSAVFPGQPTASDTAWFSQFGAVLPARIYSVASGQRRYSITVVDYNPVERLLVERSRSCPPGANTCQGIADWGIGYWKTDIRGALLYALSKFLERDAKPTSVIWNGIALVQGLELRLTNNADQSRTFGSIYMHENRLLIVESTVPGGDAAPVAFNESVNWIDEQGRAIRYNSTYVNMPDVPKPAVRGGAPAAPATGVSR